MCITTVQRSLQPSSAFTRGERSSSRPAMYGPRSTTGTVTVLAPCVRVTIVPQGSDLCATPQVSGRNWIGRPFAFSHGQHGSRFSKNPGPYHDATTTLPLGAAGTAVIGIGTAATRAGAGRGVGCVTTSTARANGAGRAIGSGSGGNSFTRIGPMTAAGSSAVVATRSVVAATIVCGPVRAIIDETSSGRRSDSPNTATPVRATNGARCGVRSATAAWNVR